MFNVKTLLIFITATTLIFSCKKNDTESQTTCRATKVNYFQTGSNPIDSAVYTYTGDKVSKVQLSSQNYTIEYTGNNLTKKNYFISAAATPEFYDLISYNTDNTISKVETFSRSSGSTYELVWRVDFAYTGGKLTKVTSNEVNNNVSSGFDEFTYTYSGNNITSASYRDLTDPSLPAETINYSYDNNPNYLKKQNSQILLVDAFFSDLDGLFIPLVVSENNVVSISGAVGSVSVTYEIDNNQNLRDFRIMQGPQQLALSRYTYTCN